MPRYTPTDLDRKDVIDVVRTGVALKLRIDKRRLLNEVENDILDEFDAALAAGEPFVLDFAKVIGELDAGSDDS